MELNKIVIHFKDGSLLKGHTSDFFQNRKSFHINLFGGKTEEIVVERLKAVFFVKDLEGDERYLYKYDDVVPGGGKKIAVDFLDGETMIGHVLGYSPQRQGFMMTSADSKGNNVRIFIVKSATKSVDLRPDDLAVPETSKPKSKEVPPQTSKPKIKEYFPQKKEEKRRHARVTSFNLMSYTCFGENRKPLGQGMGETLDIGLGGLLMETPVRIQSKYILLMAINLKEELIEIKGRVVYCKDFESKIFHTGIRFIEKNERIREIVTDMLKVFLETKSRS